MQRRLTAVLLSAALAVTACGDDSGGGGGADGSAGGKPDPEKTAAFCDEVRALQEADEGLDISDPAGLAEFEQLIAGAPAAVRSDLEYFVEQTQRFEDLDEEDPGSIGDAFGLFFDPEFIESIRSFGTFLRDECDIDVPGLEQLEDFDPDQLQEDLSNLDGQLDDLQDDLNSGLDDLQDQLDASTPTTGG